MKKYGEKDNHNLESVFIPAKEILSNAYNLREASARGNVEFDDTYLDLIASARVDISSGKDTRGRRKYLETLQKINEGKVCIEEDRFYLKPGNQDKIEFNLVAEGIRKMALLWQLIKNGTLERGSILFLGRTGGQYQSNPHTCAGRDAYDASAGWSSGICFYPRLFSG